MKILRRYIISEMITPTLLGFGFYTFMILMKSLFDFAEMIIKRSLPFSVVLRLLGLSLPHIIVLTIPMSLLFGILIAIGRMSADSEIIAMRSAGLSTSVIYKPVFIFTFCVFLLNLYLMNDVLPRGNRALQSLKAEIITSSVEKEIRPHVFFSEYENRVIYIDDVSAKTGLWKGVFISDMSDPAREKIVVADSGHLSLLRHPDQLWLDLTGAETHVFSPRKPDRYDLNRNASQRFLLLDRFADAERARQATKSIREMNVRELIAEANRSRNRDPLGHRLALVEIQKKFAIPFACLAFGIIGMPLGITNRRGGKSSGFSLSIALILMYYVMINNGEDLAREGKLSPFLAMWLPNIILITIGLFLMRRANVERGSRSGTSWISRIASKIRRHREQRLAEAGESGGGVLARLDIAFPNTLDRYVLREFAKILMMVIVSTSVLFLIIDYTEIVDDVSRNHISFEVVTTYYRYFLLQVLNWTLPVSVLVSTLITFAIFAKNNEVTAIKANGVSLYRVALPVVTVAMIISLLSYFMLDFVLPYSNQKVNDLRATIKGKSTPRTFTSTQRQWLAGKGRYIFNYVSYDNTLKDIAEIQVFEFHPQKFKLARRVWASKAHWDGSGWEFSNGWMRSFGDDGNSSYTPFTGPLKLQYVEKPDDFALEVKAPNQMTYTELNRYIRNLERAGYSAEDLRVELYKKTSWPFISLVMAMIALPFAFKVGKRGALYGMGIALFLAFVYWTVFGIFTKFGEVGNLPAVLSAWSANVLFLIAAGYMFLRVET